MTQNPEQVRGAAARGRGRGAGVHGGGISDIAGLQVMPGAGHPDQPSSINSQPSASSYR